MGCTASKTSREAVDNSVSNDTCHSSSYTEPQHVQNEQPPEHDEQPQHDERQQPPPKERSPSKRLSFSSSHFSASARQNHRHQMRLSASEINMSQNQHRVRLQHDRHYRARVENRQTEAVLHLQSLMRATPGSEVHVAQMQQMAILQHSQAPGINKHDLSSFMETVQEKAVQHPMVKQQLVECILDDQRDHNNKSNHGGGSTDKDIPTDLLIVERRPSKVLNNNSSERRRESSTRTRTNAPRRQSEARRRPKKQLPRNECRRPNVNRWKAVDC